MNAPVGSTEASAPAREALDDRERSRLHRDVREAIACLPSYFRTETHISGIMATDPHTLNTVLGATIEERVGKAGRVPTARVRSTLAITAEIERLLDPADADE